MESSLARKQLIGVASAGAAMAVVVGVIVAAPWLFIPILPYGDDTASRLVFLAHWLLLPGFMLLAGVVAASRRGFYADAIDGTRTPASRGLEINLRYNQNTLEQTVLAAIVWFALALELPHDRLVLIPAMAVLFAVGRITFWIGYLVYPIGRAFGMTMTALPTICAYLWLFLRIF